MLKEQRLDEKVYEKLVKKHGDAFETASHNVDTGAWPWASTLAWLAPQLGVGHRTAELALQRFRNDVKLGKIETAKNDDEDPPIMDVTKDGKPCYWNADTDAWHYQDGDRKVGKRKAPAPYEG